MSSYTFVDFCYKDRTIKELIDYCTTPSRELDLPGTGISKIKYYLEHDPKFKEEVLSNMLEDGYDPGKDNIAYYVYGHAKFNLCDRFGSKVHYDEFTKDLLNFAINHYKENIEEAKEALEKIEREQKLLQGLKCVTKEAVREAAELYSENDSSIKYWREEIKENKTRLKEFRRIWFWYYLAKILPKCSLQYYRD